MTSRSSSFWFKGIPLLPACLLVFASAFVVAAEPVTKGGLKSESFDADPQWDSLNNRMKPDPKEVHVVTQDFGFSVVSAKPEIGAELPW